MPSVRLLAGALLAVSLGLASGCGGEADEANSGELPGDAGCDALLAGLSFDQGCAGPPNGAWDLVRYCPFPEGYDPLGGTCGSATYATAGRASGLLALRDNGLFRFEYDERFLHIERQIPTSCYGGGEFCRGSALGGDCALNGAACSCTEDRVELAVVEQGSWSAMPSLLRFDDVSGRALDQQYCVDRSLAWLVVERPSDAGLPGVRMLFRRR